jgi:hypothetical protein
MILLHIINYFFPKPKTKTENLLKNIQNALCLPVVLLSVYATTYYYYTNDPAYLKTAINILKYYCAIDFAFCTQDIAIHHISVIGLIITYQNNAQLLQLTSDSLSTLVFAEFSTIFLIAKPYIKNATSQTINNLLFISTFFYARIYSYTKYLIYNNNLHQIFYDNVSLFDYITLKVCLYGLYAINLYWAAIIIKTICKQLKPYLLSKTICEHVLKLTFIPSLQYSVVAYRPFERPIYFADVLGQFALSISSYEYHNAITNTNIEANEDVLQETTLWPYINDVLMIHARCLLCVLTNTNPAILYTSTSITPEYANIKLALLIISTCAHVSSIYYFIKFIITLKSKKTPLKIFEENTPSTMVLNTLISIPIIIDSLIGAYCSNSHTSTNNMLLITALILINGHVKPFYQMNHLVFHVLLFFQTMCLCQSNILANDLLYNTSSLSTSLSPTLLQH